jgi:hypothetical protein
MENSKIVNLFKETYSLSLGSPKWISEGGELLKYIGQNVIMVKFKRESENSPWTNTTQMVNLVGISGFDEMTGTYTVAWKEEGENTELQSERLTPEGFSFNIPEADNWMHRFLPISLHMQITEAQQMYARYRKLWEERESMKIDDIWKYCRSKQRDTVGYKNYIALLVNTDNGIDVGITECRIKSFSNPQNIGKFWSIGIRDARDNFYVLRIPKDSETDAFKFSLNGEYIGQAKIIDLQG